MKLNFIALPSTSDRKRIFSNFISLSVLQVLNYILPLVSLPYLTRVLGVEYFGLLAFATATVGYFQIITDYGFNFTATKEISIFRDDQKKLGEIFSAVISIKVLLMLISILLLTVIVFSFKKFSKDWEIYYFSFGLVLGQVLFPIWFFQGMEKMRYITYLNIIAKSIFTIAIFIFIKQPSDYYIAPILTSIGYISVGVYSLIIIKNDFNIKFKIQPISIIRYHLKEGWHIFISGIFTSFYTTSVTFILGIFSTNQVVGYYSLANRIIGVASNIFSPLNGAIFPYISKLVIDSKIKASAYINKILIYSSIVMLIFSILLFTFAKEIVLLISSSEFVNSIIILRILAFLPLILNAATIMLTNYFINFGFQSVLSKIYLFSAALSIILSFTLVPLFFEIGSAIAVLSVELITTFLMMYFIKKNILITIEKPNKEI